MKNEKKRQVDRRANRTILGRTLFLMFFFGVAAFIPLFAKLYNLQIVQNEDLESKALRQQTRDSVVAANRGTIYDSKGEVLAMSGTVYNVQLSPRDIIETQQSYAKQVENAMKKEGEAREKAMPDYPEPTNEFIASNLAEILDVDKDEVLKRLAKTQSAYEIIKERIEGEEAEAMRQFIVENHLSHGIAMPPTTKRYYPNGSLACKVIGWVNYNNENKGAYGLEALYEEELAGQTGRVVTAKNGNGTEMLYRFEDYYDAVNGNNLTITLDTTIQHHCERILEKGIETFDVQDGGFAIAMDPNTGAILAWADSPSYDLNAPREISDPILKSVLEAAQDDPATQENEYQKALGDLQQQQWKNRAINDTYEPGSTFKSIVLAAALEEGVVNENDTFVCTGSVEVADHTIHCSNRRGHGTQTLAKAVANSCNPAFIAIGQRLGAERFYDYIEDFGILEATEIDLQGESHINPVSSGLFWSREKFTSIYGVSNLATASFGQRFQVTPIQLITAAAAVINGGNLLQPYVLQTVTDADGNVLKQTEPTVVRQVVSQETSQRCRAILETVVDGGTGGKAYVPGYRIGGKTGSSETLIDDDYTIVSFLGFAPADDPKVIILLAYNNPKPAVPGGNETANGWYISGGNMAALMAGELLENILDYMGVPKVYADKDLAQMDVTVPNAVGMDRETATAALESGQLKVRFVGDGDTVTDQVPMKNAAIPSGSTVILYMGEAKPTDLVEVPDVSNLSIEGARKALENAGLYLKASGDSESTAKAVSQTISKGTMVERGTVVSVKFLNNNTEGGSKTGL
ncbi:MAG: PASTA domain-containing protein [Oscillospiraceae bacterium]|nr:PASTA domain-containing protein [Oscillospiraceae bacterium]